MRASEKTVEGPYRPLNLMKKMVVGRRVGSDTNRRTVSAIVTPVPAGQGGDKVSPAEFATSPAGKPRDQALV
jgi:hypothetical protein